MATAAQIAANRRNAEKSTGPRTAEGKARVAQNSVTFGLFTHHDSTPPTTKEADLAISAALFEELAPVGPLEESLAAEILRACRRLDRCAAADFSIATTQNRGAADERHIGVERARVAAERSRDRAIAQLRRLQTERALRETYAESDLLIVSGLAEQRELLRGIPGNRLWQVITGTTSDYNHERLMRRDIQECDRDLAQMRLQEQARFNLSRSGTDPSSLDSLGYGANPGVAPQPTASPAQTADLNPTSSNPTKQTQFVASASDELSAQGPGDTRDTAVCSGDDEIPRNAPCPCGSTLKYKRCCGRTAPGVFGGHAVPILTAAA